jgi:formate hydrogenlyase subunit 6
MSIKVAPFLPEMLRSLFKKPATVKYPFEKTPVPPGFRGNVVFDPPKCIGCMICVNDCPAEAIDIIRVSETEKKFKMILHNDRCIHCAQCVDSCPTKTYHMDSEFELAVLNRHQLKIEYKKD